jgi:EpsI family protein
MNRESATTAVVAAALVLAGAVAWMFALRPALELDVSPLRSFPTQLGPWYAEEDVPLEGWVESMLEADYNLQRRYRDPTGGVVWVYVGYYGTQRGGRPEHTPPACFRAHGWTIEDRRVVDLGGGLRVNEMPVSLEGEQQLVHYWFRSFRSPLRGGLDQLLDRLIGRVRYQRADGSLVRVSTAYEGEDDRLVARRRLSQFGALFDDALADHWPYEEPAGHSPPPRRIPLGKKPLVSE